MNLVHRLAGQLPLAAALTVLILVAAGCSGLDRTGERQSRSEYMSFWPHLRAAKSATFAETWAHLRADSGDVSFLDHVRLP